MTTWWQSLSEAQRRFWQAGLVVALACLWLYGAGNARYGLFDVDEGVFTQATVEMRQSGEFSMPTYNGEPRYHKPPLIYWAQSAAMSALGNDSLYAARLPSVLGALGTILVLGWGVAYLTGSRRWGLMAAGVMALNLSFVVVGRAATADGLLNFFSVLLALWTVHMLFPGSRVLDRGEAKMDAALLTARIRKVAARATASRYQWLLTGGLAAVGFLAKGPVAWVPAALMVLFVLAFRKDRALTWTQLAPLKAGGFTLLLLLPWVLLLLYQFGAGFFYDFFIQQNLHRYAGGLTNTQSDSVFYYVAILLVGFFPWVFLLPKAVGLTLKGGIRRVRSAMNGEDPARALPYLALVWAVGYIVFFSFSQTKLAHYIVPAYPALAILVGAVLAQRPLIKISTFTALLGAIFGLVLALLMLVLNPLLLGLRHEVLTGWLGWLQAVFGFEWPPHDAAAAAVLALPVHLDAAPVFIGVLMVGAVVPAWMLLARGVRGGIFSLMMAWTLTLGLISWGVVPTVWRYTQAPLAEFAQIIKEAPETTAIVHVGMHKPSVLYLSGRPFTKLDKPLQVPDNITSAETLILTEEDKVMPILTELGLRGNAHVLGQRCGGGFCLLTVARVGLPGEVDVNSVTPKVLGD